MCDDPDFQLRDFYTLRIILATNEKLSVWMTVVLLTFSAKKKKTIKTFMNKLYLWHYEELTIQVM
jgi:5'-3' exonuclease